jgi:hypothetical protein
MGGSLIVQFYRYLGAVSTAIGSPYTLVAGAANQSQGFSLETIDSAAPGNYTYALNLIQSNGTTTWGAYSGAVLNAVELRGAKGSTGPTGPNLLTTANTFTNTNAFTNTVTISSLVTSTVGNLNLAVTNVSTQNTQIVQTATGNPTTSYTVVQALHSNTAGSGITYNTLALNPSGGNVGVGTNNPSSLLQVNGTTAVNALLMNAGGTAFQIARANNAGSGVTSGSITFPFTFTNVPAVTTSISSASNTQVFSVNVSNITVTGFSYVKTYYFVSGASGGPASEGFHWIALG